MTTPDSQQRFGTLDGSGAADHDEPYQFGRRPRAQAPFPFTERQFARLLVLRGRVQDHTETRTTPRLRLLKGGRLPNAA